MPHPYDAARALRAESLTCLGLCGLTALMLAIPESSPELAHPWSIPWWLALGASTLTLGCVFAHRPLLVGAILGLGVPLAELALSGAGSIAALSLALVLSFACAGLGARLHRRLVPRFRRLAHAHAVAARP